MLCGFKGLPRKSKNLNSNANTDVGVIWVRMGFSCPSIRGDGDTMARLCPKSVYPITLGCAPLITKERCEIVVANDDIIKAQGWTFPIVVRHEIGHCNGWSKDHPGARPL